MSHIDYTVKYDALKGWGKGDVRNEGVQILHISELLLLCFFFLGWD